MTAVKLFDALARASQGRGNALPGGELVPLAQKLVAAALDDLQRLRDYEQQCLTGDWRDGESHGRLTQLLHDLYRQWSDEAAQVMDRVQALTSVRGAEDLEQACWRVRARLQLTPERVLRATEQARRDETVPAEVLRDELRARLRS